MKHEEKEPMRRFEKRMVALSSVMILLSLFLLGKATGTFTGQLMAKEVKKENKESFYLFSDVFAEIYQDIKEKYVEEVDEEELFENAIQGMFAALDPHSQYLDPDNFNQLEKETEGEFSGIGIHLSQYPLDPDLPPSEANRILTVVSPIPGSPAAEAGVLSWDQITEIEGETTQGLSIYDAVRKLTGPEGTRVSITVQRKGEPKPLTFTMTRRQIKIESIYSKMLEDNILLVRIARFSDNTSKDLRKAIEKGKSDGAKALIIDLRLDTGGLLTEAVQVSELFLNKGDLIVSTKGRSKSQNKEYHAEGKPITDWPMLILINKGTASASEIFAGAMRDHNRALLIGPKGGRTFGKGSVQTIDPLEYSLEKDENGNYKRNAIRLTTARYYTPNGTAIDNHEEPEKAGLAPDLEVELTPEHEIELARRGLLLGEPNMVDPNGKDGSDPLIEELSEEEEAALLKEISRIAEVDDPSKITITVEREDEPALHYTVGGSEDGKDEMVDLQLQFAVEEMNRIMSGKPTPSVLAKPEAAEEVAGAAR